VYCGGDCHYGRLCHRRVRVLHTRMSRAHFNAIFTTHYASADVRSNGSAYASTDSYTHASSTDSDTHTLPRPRSYRYGRGVAVEASEPTTTERSCTYTSEPTTAERSCTYTSEPTATERSCTYISESTATECTRQCTYTESPYTYTETTTAELPRQCTDTNSSRQ
jgi:hypothetical protein